MSATAFEAGSRVINNGSLTLDSSYNLSDNWKFNGYWTRSGNRWNVNKTSIGDNTVNNTNTAGLSVKGKVTGKVSVGMDVIVSDDSTSFTNNSAPGAPTPAAQNLPTITYQTTKLNVFGMYEIDKKSAVKVNLAYQEFKTDDWQWGYNGTPFIYSDNTTVSNPNQYLTFVGVAYQYKF